MAKKTEVDELKEFDASELERSFVLNGGTTLVSSKGSTSISDEVVAKIAGIAAREIPGVHSIATSSMSDALAGIARRVTGGDTKSRGVKVIVGKKEAIVDLQIVVHYGVSIPGVAEGVRENIISAIGEMTGLKVKEVNIGVSDLYFPADDLPDPNSKLVE